MASDAPRVLHHVDKPGDWEGMSRCLLLRGWCFDRVGNPIRAVRLRTGELTLAGVVGLPRPDVKAAFADAPDDNTGFEIRGTLPAGRHAFLLEAQTADGEWHGLSTRAATVKRQFLPSWLGGGDPTALIFFQMPAHMAYPARPVRPENFPTAQNSLPRPKFSIVTPSFQQARFLAETMRSVLEQPDVACDYVVQDGGSTDGSVAIIKQFAPPASPQVSDPKSQISAVPAPRVAAWASAPDQGQADAIAKGFAKTSGAPSDVMAWINSDDFYLPGALSFVADYFARHPAVDVLYGHRIVVNEESQEIARWFLPKHDDTVLRLNDFVPQETLFWRRRIWDQVGGLDSSFKFAMDWDLLLRFQAAGANIVRVPRFLACFRVHPGQKTSAAMHDVGQGEIDRLRTRANDRAIPTAELEREPRLVRYLRRSSFIQFLWSLGIRGS